MKKEHVYSTAEVCGMFNISKSTLFRWEREAQLPIIPRDISGQREYTHTHIRAISERQKNQLRKQYAHAIKTGDEASLMRISEAISLRKFLEGDITGLYELAELQEISTNTLKQIMRIGLDRFEPRNRVFCEIIRVLWEHTRNNCHE